MVFEFILFICTWELIENTFLTRPTLGIGKWKETGWCPRDVAPLYSYSTSAELLTSIYSTFEIATE